MRDLLNTKNLEDDWSQCLDDMGLVGAVLLSASAEDLGRRVYLVADTVYKIVLFKLEASQQRRRQDLRGEYEIMKRCCHLRAVPEVYCFRQTESFAVMKLKYVPGEVLEGAKVGVFQFIRILCSLSLVVYYLADLKICHNDLRARNVIVSQQGKIFLVDFDQAYECNFKSGILKSIFGLDPGVHSKDRSLLRMLRHQVKQWLPLPVYKFIRKLLGKKTILE